MVKYYKIFLKKIKALLSYIVKFKEDNTILPKKYLDDYTARGSDQKLIIIIIPDKSIFSTNNNCHKV